MLASVSNCVYQCITTASHDHNGVSRDHTTVIMVHHMILQFLKNITLHRRNVATLLCQVIAPVVIISLAGFLQVCGGWGYSNDVIMLYPADVI